MPYKDSGQLQLDLVTGRLPIVVTGQSNLVEMHRQGRIRIVAVSGAQRTAMLPEVPTLMESGVNVSSATTVGIFGPAGMAPELVRKLNAALTGATGTPEARDRLARIAFAPSVSTPEALAAEIVAEHKRFGALVAASGYVPE